MAIDAREIIAGLPGSRQERIRAMAGRILAREYPSSGECAEFEFTLILDGVSRGTPELIAALDEAGCADALLSDSGGVVSAAFVRAAPTKTAAILSAIQDARRAGVKVLSVEGSMPPDRGTAAVNSALSLASTLELDPQLFSEVMTLLPGTHGR